MNLYAKTALLACGVAVASSAITMLAVNSIDSTDSVAQSVTTLFNEDGTSHSGGAFYTVANTVTPPTDFTHAAESTINGVVSIKCYSNRQQYSQGAADSILTRLNSFSAAPSASNRAASSPSNRATKKMRYRKASAQES